MSKVSEATKAKRRTATLLPPGRASKRLSVSCARNVPLPKPRTACGVKRQAGRLPSTPSVRCVALYGTLCVCIVSVVHLHPTVVAPAPSSSLFAVPSSLGAGCCATPRPSGTGRSHVGCVSPEGAEVGRVRRCIHACTRRIRRRMRPPHLPTNPHVAVQTPMLVRFEAAGSFFCPGPSRFREKKLPWRLVHRPQSRKGTFPFEPVSLDRFLPFNVLDDWNEVPFSPWGGSSHASLLCPLRNPESLNRVPQRVM